MKPAAPYGGLGSALRAPCGLWYRVCDARVAARILRGPLHGDLERRA